MTSQAGRSWLSHHLAGDDKLTALSSAGERVHQVQHEVFDDHPQAARANLALERHVAIASSASSVKRSLTFSYSNSFWYCV